jgi:hypothetical protein
MGSLFQMEIEIAQIVRAKQEKKERKEREMLEKNKVKELLRARKAASKEEVRKNKERVKAHLDQVARIYNEKKQREKEREKLLKKSFGKESPMSYIPDRVLKNILKCNTVSSHCHEFFHILLRYNLILKWIK